MTFPLRAAALGPILSLALFSICGQLLADPPQPIVIYPNAAAIRAADRFLAFLDRGKFRQAFDVMAPRVRVGETTLQDFMIYWTARRAPLGLPISRTIVKARYNNNLSTAPDGNYEFLTYKTKFERRAEAFEYVTLTFEGAHWEVSGYQIR